MTVRYVEMLHEKIALSCTTTVTLKNREEMLTKKAQQREVFRDVTNINRDNSIIHNDFSEEIMIENRYPPINHKSTLLYNRLNFNQICLGQKIVGKEYNNQENLPSPPSPYFFPHSIKQPIFPPKNHWRPW